MREVFTTGEELDKGSRHSNRRPRQAAVLCRIRESASFVRDGEYTASRGRFMGSLRQFKDFATWVFESLSHLLVSDFAKTPLAGHLVKELIAGDSTFSRHNCLEETLCPSSATSYLLVQS